jgi:hypothetical protein
LVIVHGYKTDLLVDVGVVLCFELSTKSLEEKHIVEIAHDEGRGYLRLAIEHPNDHLVQNDRQNVKDHLRLELDLVLDGLNAVKNRIAVLHIVILVYIYREPSVKVGVIS